MTLTDIADFFQKLFPSNCGGWPVLALAGVIFGWIQETRVTKLKGHLDDADKALDTIKKAYGPDVVEWATKVEVEKAVQEKDKEIEQKIQELKAGYEKKLEHPEKYKEALSREMTALIKAAARTFIYALPAERESILKEMPTSAAKVFLTAQSTQRAEWEKQHSMIGGPWSLHPNIIARHRAKALREASSEENLQQNSENEE